MSAETLGASHCGCQIANVSGRVGRRWGIAREARYTHARSRAVGNIVVVMVSGVLVVVLVGWCR